MEDPESEWKLIQCSKRMLTNGYVIGRDIVMTGIVISVVPPLVAFSTMGFAFSVPFGVLFASYACTNKLMSLLLPTPTPTPLMLEYYNYPEAGLDDDATDKEDDNELLTEIGFDYRQPVELRPSFDAAAGDDDQEGGFKYKGDENWNRESQSNTDEVIATLMDERWVVEDVSDDVFGENKDVETITEENLGSEMIPVVISSGENIFKVRVAEELARQVIIGDPNGDERKIESEKKISKVDHSNANAWEIGENNLEVVNQVKENVAKSKDEDEKIWEKIEAMRRIVGYKAPRESTCIGELKALYVFTGVEPPEGDMDLHAKLKFLMAIVGVK